MIRNSMTVLAAAAMLAGCAQDDPDNVPLRGEWRLTQTLDSITVNGALFAASDLPPGMLELEKSETVCGEPLYVDRDWQARDVARRTKGSCELDQYSHDRTSARFTGMCTIEAKDVTFTPKVRGRSSFSELSARDVVTMEGSVTTPGSSSSDYLKIIAVQASERIGDC